MANGMQQRGSGAAVLATVVWGSAFAAIEVGLTGFGPGALALLRFGLASMVLFVVVWLRDTPRPDFADIPRLLVLGFWGVAVYHVALNTGQENLHPAAASFLIATTPTWTLLYSSASELQPPGVLQALGVVTALTGVAVLTLSRSGAVALNYSAGLVLLSSWCAAYYFVAGKSLVDKYGALSFTAYSFLAGTLFLLVYLPALIKDASTASLEALIAAGFLGVMPAGFAYLLWFHAVEVLGAARTAVFMNLVPIFATGLAVALSRSTFTFVELVGGVCVVGGVAVSQFLPDDGTTCDD
jgi:drug/metabolite transporter (DMT)-like permease